MKRSKVKIIAILLSVLLLVPIGVYGYFVVHAQDYVEIWEPEKGSKKKKTKAAEEFAPAMETATEPVIDSEPEASETESAQQKVDTQSAPAAEAPAQTQSAPTSTSAKQPLAVIVGTRKKDDTPKTADFEMDSKYLLCTIMALAGISVLLLSKSREEKLEQSKIKSQTKEKRRWEKAWEESRKG